MAVAFNIKLFAAVVGAAVFITLLFYSRLLPCQHMEDWNFDSLLRGTDRDINRTDVEMYNGTFHVPNVIHFIRFGQPVIEFLDLICIKAAYLHIKPDKIKLHVDERPVVEAGYWQELVQEIGEERLEVMMMKRPMTVFGQEILVVQHSSDVARIYILLKEGGIYLDNDVYSVKSFDKFRKLNKCTLGMPVDKDPAAYIGNQILVCPPNDLFMRRYLNTYKNYTGSKWYWNAGGEPTVNIIRKQPDIVNAVPDTVFGVSTGLFSGLYRERRHFDWRKFYAIHLLYRHRWYLHKEDFAKTPKHGPAEVKGLNTTFGEMARDVIGT